MDVSGNEGSPGGGRRAPADSRGAVAGGGRREPPDGRKVWTDGRTLADGLLFVATLNLLSIPIAGGFAFSVGGLQLGSPSFLWSLVIWLAAAGVRFGGRIGELRPGSLGAWLKARRYGLLVALLTVVGFGLRIAGIDFGLPLLVQPDEPSVAGVAVELLRSGWIDPQWYVYPTFFMLLMLPAFAIYYVYGRGNGLLAPLDQVRATTPGFYLIGRYHSAVLGTLTIPLSYWLARRLLGGERGRQAGLIAAAIVTFSFIHVRESHFAVTDVPAAAVTTAALIAIAGVLHRGSTRDYLAAGLLCGLAASTKYTAAPVVLSLAAAHLLGRRPEPWLGRAPAIGLAAVPAGFLLGSPYALLNWKPFLEHLGWLGTYAGNPSPAQVRGTFAYVVGYSAESGFGRPVFWLLVAALAVALWRRQREQLVLIAFVLGSLPQMTYSTHRFFPRFLVPLVPPVAVLVGGLVADGIAWLQERQWLRPRYRAAAVAAIGLVLVAPTSFETLVWVRTAGRLDSRTEAYFWIRERFPGGAVIVTEEPLIGMPATFRVLDWPPPVNQYGREELERESVDVVVLAAPWEPPDAQPAAAQRQRLKTWLGEPRRFEGYPGRARPGPNLEVYVVPRPAGGSSR
jgi:4-amino-4-deoxy-L-arabinose transferase-like glycosyltransferase